MKRFNAAVISTTVALFCSQVIASPAVPATFLKNRQASQITTAVIQIFQQIFKGSKLAYPEASLAWDYASNPNMCQIYMETKDGANCWAQVACNDGVKEYNVGKAGWNVCYIGGRQFFNDPRIGDFSITFTNKDKEGEGLTGPLLQLADIGNWMDIPVSALAGERHEFRQCKAHNGVDCEKSSYICTYDYSSNNGPFEGRTRKWFCGVPKRGQNFQGLDSNVPTPKGYAPGACGIHITQYQKPDPSKDQYSLAARIMDANQNEIGNSGGKQVGPVLVLTTPLPNTFTITAKAVDTDSLRLGYDGVEWDAVAPACSVGAYDSGKREMDCGFTCK
ncbi:hypothetical protein BKA63DRAFT_548669 [Paraphoma chrysanthemicola]|nr:hypothetical protein BKA63DRAFT_548669 [Paraphoma chrysanthemicola]